MVSSMMSSRFGEGFRRPSDREDIVYWDRGQLGLSIDRVAVVLASLHVGASLIVGSPCNSRQRKRSGTYRASRFRSVETELDPGVGLGYLRMLYVRFPAPQPLPRRPHSRIRQSSTPRSSRGNPHSK